MVCVFPVTATVRLLISGVDVPATRTNAAIQEGASHLLMMRVMVPIQDQWAKVLAATTTRLSMPRIDLTASAAVAVVEVMPSEQAVVLDAVISHQRGMGPIVSVHRRAIPASVPVMISRSSRARTTPVLAAITVALIDPAESAGQIEEFIIDRVVHSVRASLTMIPVFAMCVNSIIIPIHLLAVLMVVAFLVDPVLVVAVLVVTLLIVAVVAVTLLMLPLLAVPISVLLGPQDGVIPHSDAEGTSQCNR